MSDIENTANEMAENVPNPHDSKAVRHAVAIGSIVATTIIEDSIIKGILTAAKKHTVPAAALTVAKTGWSVSGGLGALAVRSAITGVAGLAGAVAATTLVHLTVDIIETIKSMPDAVETEEQA